MSLQVFKYQMNMGAGAEVRHNVTKTQFGDGYAQRVSHGINNKRTDWSGTKVGDYETVIKPIADFLDAHGGVKPFLWTNPHGETKQYVCQDYQVTQRKGNFWQISLKFEQSNSDGSSAPLLDFSNQNSGTSTPNLPQSALTAINLALQDEIERSTQKDDAHDKAIQSLNTSKTSLSKAIDEIKEQLAGVSSAPASVTWDSITGKPSSFNPSSHSHNWNDITNKPQSFNPSSHDHTISDISGLQSLLNAKANSNHSHTWNDITNKPSSFVPSAHTHRASDISDLQTILSKYATKDEIPQINTDDLTIDTSNLATTTALSELETAMRNFLNAKADKDIRLTAGSGLSGGGNLTTHRTISLGTPSSITASSGNEVTAISHTHEIAKASDTQAGIVQLSNSTDGTRQTIAATEFALNEVRKLISDSSSGGSITEALNRKSYWYSYRNEYNASFNDTTYSYIDTFTFPDGRIVCLVRLEGIKPTFFSQNIASAGDPYYTRARTINLATAMPSRIISVIPQITRHRFSANATLGGYIVGWDWTHNIDPNNGDTLSKSQVKIQFSSYQGNIATNDKIDLSIIVEGY